LLRYEKSINGIDPKKKEILEECESFKGKSQVEKNKSFGIP
jgi:hypothetical protein